MNKYIMLLKQCRWYESQKLIKNGIYQGTGLKFREKRIFKRDVRSNEFNI
ncbi:hypothetical protein SH2C18_18750 [Clostridium sediminicola]